MDTPNVTRTKWYYNVWFVLAMLFLVLGPFGLPLVWKHPTFSKRLKVTLTVVTLVYTILLVDGTVRAVRAVLEQVEQLNAATPF